MWRDPIAVWRVSQRMSKAETHPSPAEARAKLGELIDSIDIAMLTTVTPEEDLHARPMATLRFDREAGHLWFFTSDDSPKVNDIYHDRRVGLTYAEPDDQRYVSVAGRAMIVEDATLAEEMWTPMAKIWFPQGPTDPRLVLLRVDVESAQYWDSPSSKMVALWGFAKQAVTGKPPRDLGDNEKVDY